MKHVLQVYVACYRVWPARFGDKVIISDEAIAVYSKILRLHSSEETEENHKKFTKITRYVLRIFTRQIKIHIVTVARLFNIIIIITNWDLTQVFELQSLRVSEWRMELTINKWI